ncbi:MAG: hypothetical protein QM479_13075 [Pseudomonadota bacterium]
MFIKNNQPMRNKVMFIKSCVFILLMLIFVNIPAADFKRYKFPPLENTNTLNNKTSASNYRNVQEQTPSSYYRQPKYIFPELEKNKNQSYGYSDRSDKYRYPSEEQQYSKKHYNEELRSNTYQDRYRYDSKSSYQPNYYRNNSYKNYSNYKNKQNSYEQFNPVSQYTTMNPWTTYSSPYNSSPYQRVTPFLNNNYFQNNINNTGWNPFSNSLSNGPNFNNGSMNNPNQNNPNQNNPNQNYPNIRTPGFFSR